MDDLIQQLAAALPALAPILAAVVGLLRPNENRQIRDQMLKETQIMAALPDGSTAKQVLGIHFAVQATKLSNEHKLSRDLPMFAVAVTSSVALIALTSWLWGLTQWWSYPLAVLSGALAIVFLFGIFETLQMKDRSKAEKPAKSSE